VIAASFAIPAKALAHCDTVSGPVVAAARSALERGDPSAVLVWVHPSEEPEVRRAFAQVLAVRTLSDAARSLADRFFFETVVRLHRLGEGEPYTGLKEAPEIDPVIDEVDAALRSGNLKPLEELLSDTAIRGLRVRFQNARDRQPHARDDVDAGRKYVAAYVEFIHYVENLHAALLP
jgi:hypothetical protein